MERVEKPRILCEPFIDEGERQFIVNGLDSYNIATTVFADYFPASAKRDNSKLRSPLKLSMDIGQYRGID